MTFLLPYLCILLLSASHALAIGIAEILAQTPELSALNTVLTSEHPEFLVTLNSTTGTFFAPSDDAMSAFMSSIDPDTFNPDVIKDLIAYHLLPGTFTAKDLSVVGGVVAETSLTNAEYVNLDPGKPNVVFASAYGAAGLDSVEGPLKVYSGAGEAAAVTKPDLAYEGGLVHVVDQWASNLSHSPALFD
jgi:uncharacterized surface protein with fasciclin (FAS1) repeats